MNQVNITNLPVWELQVRSVLSKLSSAPMACFTASGRA